MNTRICSVIASVTLLTLSSGCGGPRSYLFGRGARCGICRPRATTVPAYTPVPAYTTAPTYAPSQPVVAVPPTPAAPAAPAVPYQPRCRLFGRQPRYQQPMIVAPAPQCVCPSPCGTVYPQGCGNCCGGCNQYNCCRSSCGDCSVPSPCGGCNTSDCGCSGMTSGCSGMTSGCDQVITDPYLQGEVSTGTIGTPIVGDQVIEGQVYPNTVTPVQPDDFSARKFDSDGNRILWEEPIPKGTTSL